MYKPQTSEFSALRLRAKKKRDLGVAALQAEYHEALAKIAELEQDLLGLRPSNYTTISSSVEAVIPREASFTITDVMSALEALDPRRVWRRRSVEGHIFRLRERGLLRRVSRSKGIEGAVYARREAPVKAGPLGDLSLMQVVGRVLTKPMTATEITVAVCEAGWETKMKREHLRQHIKKELARNGYKLDGGKWVP